MSLPYWFVCNFYSFEKALMRNENWVDEWETTDCKTIAAFAIKFLLFWVYQAFRRKTNNLIWNKTFGRKEKIDCFGVNVWPKFKEQADEWSEIKIHKDNKEYVYISTQQIEWHRRTLWENNVKCLWVIF